MRTTESQNMVKDLDKDKLERMALARTLFVQSAFGTAAAVGNNLKRDDSITNRLAPDVSGWNATESTGHAHTDNLSSWWMELRSLELHRLWNSQVDTL